MTLHASDCSTEVIAAIDVVANPREAAVVANMHFCGTQDVGIAGATKGIIDTTVAQISVCVTTHTAFVTSGIEVFRFGQGRPRFFFRIAGIRSFQVYSGAIIGVVLVQFAICGVFACSWFVVTFWLAGGSDRFTHHALFAATEYLEAKAVVVVHSGAAPYLSVFTIPAAKHRKGNSHHIDCLLVVYDTGVPRSCNG